MKNIKVVIGANFGDEGKGLMTNYFSNINKDNSVVIRFNGSCQAGHTSIQNGVKHVFGHFGSGALAGVPTYLDRNFIVNPWGYCKEKEELATMDVSKVYASSECLVTTYIDIIINQIIELKRGNNRHGSCGMGINETIVRSKYPEYCIKFGESYSDLIVKIKHILECYVPKRFKELGIESNDIPSEVVNTLFSDDLKCDWMQMYANTLMDCELVDEVKLLEFDNLIFEGAQGLMLDMDYKFFPHVTHSHTGIKNVIDLIDRLTTIKKFEYALETCYVTRCYMTRHGAGEFPTETKEIPYSGIVDTTNIPNEWQGSIRFGLLDLDNLQNNINADLSYIHEDENCKEFKSALAVTCLDQVDNGIIKYIYADKKYSDGIGMFLNILVNKLNMDILYCSYGERSSDVTKRILNF